jgi:MFS family permease
MVFRRLLRLCKAFLDIIWLPLKCFATGVPVTFATDGHGFLSAWRYPQYRLLWISSFSMYIGRWAETVVVSWLVLELTNSPFLVGLVGACRSAGMLLGPFAGTIADRFNRRRILLAVQITYGTAAMIIMILLLSSRFEVWHLFVFALVGGVCFSFDWPARYTVAADIVKTHHLLAAMSFLIVAMESTRLFGPLIGGSLLGIIGAAGCFALVTGCFLVSSLVLLPMKTTPQARQTVEGSVWANLADGFHYIKNDKTLFALILIAALVNLFVIPYWYTLMPIFARDILHTGAGGFGRLMAAIGLGATIGSLATGSLPDFLSKGKLLIAAITAWPAVLIIFSFSRLLPLSATLLVFAGGAGGMAMALIQSLLLMWSSVEMRGRVSGARAFAISTLPLGNLLMGAGASFLGAPMVLVISNSAAILIAVLIAIWAPSLRNRRLNAPTYSRR